MAASEVWPTNKQWTKLFTVNINGIMLDQAIANSSDVPAGGIEGLLVEWAAGIPPPCCVYTSCNARFITKCLPLLCSRGLSRIFLKSAPSNFAALGQAGVQQL